jgi:ketosteroid isomerase-like protein
MSARTVTAVSVGAVSAFVVAIFLLTSCSTPPARDTRPADEETIRKLDADWVKAAQSKQVDAWVAFYSDDAAVLPPNESVANGRDQIKKSVSGLLGLPGLEISWRPTRVEAARASDLAYLYGTYEVSFDESPGKRTIDRGKIVEIWKKQADGNWKCVVDTWNSDLPTAPATPVSEKTAPSSATSVAPTRSTSHSRDPEPRPSSAQSNLIVNGSFEAPPVKQGEYVLEPTGSTFPGWTVVGAPGDVAPISGAFAYGGFTFPAQDGKQWIDLTGNTQVAAGIEQVVKTEKGRTYELSFYVGNVVNPGGLFGTVSTVEVLIGGRSQGKFANSHGTTTQEWSKFAVSFRAEGAATKVTFINRDGPSDSLNGLDNVVLSRHDSR